MTTPTSKFKIALTAAGLGSSIEIDGKKIDGVKAVTIRAEAGQATTVTLEFIAPAATEVAGEGIVQDPRA